jgi:hypothetical protein
MIYIIAIIVILWIACGILSYGFSLAYFQKQYPILAFKQQSEDIRFAIFSLLFGAFSLIPCLLNREMRKHGLMFSTKKYHDTLRLMKQLEKIGERNG